MGGERRIHGSKLDSWLARLLLGCGVMSVLTVAAVVRVKPDLTVQLIVFLCTAWFSTAAVTWPMMYTVGPEILLVRSGFITWKIPIKSIRSVTPTNNPISAPAWSLDRLQIVYERAGRMEQLCVSPMDREAFLEDLSRVDPNLHIHDQAIVRRGVEGL